MDGVELGGGEVCMDDEEQAGDEGDVEVAWLVGVADGLEQPVGVVSGCVHPGAWCLVLAAAARITSITLVDAFTPEHGAWCWSRQ